MEALVSLLREVGVRRVVDVRSVPRSRHTPQWNRERAAEELAGLSLAYTHLPALGGFRKPRSDSPNTGWKSLAFRGYADYMTTVDFARGLEALLRLAATEPTVFACTEALPERCHRTLIADALTVRGAQVRHLVRTGEPSSLHTLTSFARVQGRALSYPDPAALC